MIYLKLIRESYLFAIRELVVNKTRTFLSLLGITIGIFAIISVFTVFDSMEKKIRTSIDSFGSNTLFISKWPWITNGETQWWKYMNRPQPSIDDLKTIQKRSLLVDAAAFSVNKNKTIKNGNNLMENMQIKGITYEHNKVTTVDIITGRYFTQSEINNGRRVALIGNEIAQNLFPNEEAKGKTFKIGGMKTYVIGVMKKKGDDAFGNSPDKQIFIPINYMKSFVDLRWSDNSLMVKAKSNVTNEELKGEITGILRAAHRIKPAGDDDFAINESSVISNQFDQFFGTLSALGWLIGGFSLLVGGFGIANIMFMSVKERIKIIGIQKSLGAKQYFILTQFLFEAIFLSILGGLFGLLFVFILGLIVTFGFEMELMLSGGNIMLGITVSSIIGMVSGLWPALSASKLDPVVAMRSV